MSDTGAAVTEADEQEPSPGDLRRMLEKAQEEAKAAKAEAQNLRVTSAFEKAGIPDDGIGALIRKTYEGEPDADAIKAYAAEHGFTSDTPAATPEPEAPQVPAETVAAAQRTQEAAATGGAPGEAPSLADQINAAQSPAEVRDLIVKAGGTVT